MIALKHRYIFEQYSKEGINEKNKDTIAANYGYQSRYSGKKLLNHFNTYANKSNRIFRDSERQLSHKIKHLKTTIELLADFPNAQKAAMDELFALDRK